MNKSPNQVLNIAKHKFYANLESQSLCNSAKLVNRHVSVDRFFLFHRALFHSKYFAIILQSSRGNVAVCKI